VSAVFALVTNKRGLTHSEGTAVVALVTNNWNEGGSSQAVQHKSTATDFFGELFLSAIVA